MPLKFMARPDAGRVREIRRAREMTQDDLARRTGLSRPYISEIERGRLASKTAMRRIARALGVGFEQVTLPREAAGETDPDEQAHAARKKVA